MLAVLFTYTLFIAYIWTINAILPQLIRSFKLGITVHMAVNRVCLSSYANNLCSRWISKARAKIFVKPTIYNY